jgi:predicted branched-subunit amino acid permease
MNRKNLFLFGFRAMLPITTGVIPFGAVMGTVCTEAKLSFFQTMSMNVLVYAGAAQLAAVDLMSKNAASTVVIITGLIINLRFLLYSAALSPVVQKSGFLTKLFCAYSLTDQNYAVMSANNDKFRSHAEAIMFYMGASLCMLLTWHCSVAAGFLFGNFAPRSLSLDCAVPLSFVALVVPTLKSNKYLMVTIFSSIVSLFLNSLPYKTGLVATAMLSILLATILTRRPYPND